MNRITLFFSFLCLLSGFSSMGQTLSRSVIGTTGSTSEILSYTVGEVVIATGNSPDLILTQGFQQPDQEVNITSLDPVLGQADFSVYPNPTGDQLFLEMTSGAQQSLRIEFTDIQGRTVLQDPRRTFFVEEPVRYSMGRLEAGIYLLHLRSESGRLIRTLRIQKK